ncbi:MAG TPA: 4-hydroxy-3-methylbut-2-enyl diphosphate reductase, partial [Desulfomonilaceae bacterium]|nr:4-hydroxy-3-methylbut-2-enyl diphosphate reductase [Desulfomonilaceae bacterium]
MKIRLAKTAGFCMGVRRAVDMVLDLQRAAPALPIVTYGPLIHNPQTLELLRTRGILEVSSIDQITGGTAVIRAHGISPQEKQLLQAKGVGIVDATCPRVARVQAVIRKHAAVGQFCVIVGDEDHPEVRGLMGFASAGGLAIPSLDNGLVDQVPQDREICVVAQTTQETETFVKVVEEIRKRCPKLNVYNTVCDSTKRRQLEISRLARQVDVIVVVGGKGSGN